MRLLTAVLFASFALVACSDSEEGEAPPVTEGTPATEETSEEGGEMSLSEAFCSDLESGLTPMNIYGGSSEYTPEEFADMAYGWAAIECPEQLESNEGLRQFLMNWDINPDA